MAHLFRRGIPDNGSSEGGGMGGGNGECMGKSDPPLIYTRTRFGIETDRISGNQLGGSSRYPCDGPLGLIVWQSLSRAGGCSLYATVVSGQERPIQIPIAEISTSVNPQARVYSSWRPAPARLTKFQLQWRKRSTSKDGVTDAGEADI